MHHEDYPQTLAVASITRTGSSESAFLLLCEIEFAAVRIQDLDRGGQHGWTEGPLAHFAQPAGSRR